MEMGVHVPVKSLSTNTLYALMFSNQGQSTKYMCARAESVEDIISPMDIIY